MSDIHMIGAMLIIAFTLSLFVLGVGLAFLIIRIAQNDSNHENDSKIQKSTEE